MTSRTGTKIVLIFGILGLGMDLTIHYLISGIAELPATTIQDRLLRFIIDPNLGFPVIWIHMTAHLMFFSAFAYLIVTSANSLRKNAPELNKPAM